ncbi:predicted protein [Naegleria gruberi]|uniref:Predicted protein n=1 Tax=Naegleria gruberi TaxID=5762 RepID=D2W0J8_NAEGR|nr:uncharacterized protein NAEGRDRAFT_74885 [Naegleria gruberi]EFC37491.1 predicted protein [Naegleria gruberi]|eukprot:XP_002670235.1 predicted protein [Naegleria gruberi strain NEG-M]
MFVNKSTLIFTLLVATMLVCTFANAQTCKTKTPNFEPSYCPSCTTCSGSAKNSCCDATMDTTMAAVIALANNNGVQGSCVDALKEYNCAFCDPKNQGYLTTDASGVSYLNVCKSKCNAMVNGCGNYDLKIKCDKFPETNCWNSANSLSAHAMVVLILSLITFFMF